MGWGFVLVEIFVWLLLTALLFGLLGWWLRSLRARQAEREHERARAALLGECDSRQARIAELERDLAAARARADAGVTDLQTCRARVTDLEAQAAAASERAEASEAKLAELTATAGRVQVLEVDLRDARQAAERSSAAEAAARARVTELEARLAASPVPGATGAVAGEAGATAHALVGGGAAAPAPTFDAAAAAAALGKRITVDDLKIVEGIGPKIEELLHADGIRTWRELAGAAVERLQDVLRRGGDRFRMHDPATWPRQAGLAADGRFAELKALQDELNAGRE